MNNLIATALLATTLPTILLALPTLVGYRPVTIKPGTNVVENLPATTGHQPQLRDFLGARAGDTVVWHGESHTFDGKEWTGKNGGEAKIPIPAKFTLIRTANATNVWDIAFEIDPTKVEPEKKKTAR